MFRICTILCLFLLSIVVFCEDGKNTTTVGVKKDKIEVLDINNSTTEGKNKRQEEKGKEDEDEYDYEEGEEEDEKKEKKCPDGFKLYKRTPTKKNRMTKEWCLGVIEHEDVYDRALARSVCMEEDSAISTVENQQELDDVNAIVMKYNKRIAVDGVFNPKCRGWSNWKLRKFTGPCKKEKELFVLEDDHTDPTFIFRKWSGEPPSTADKYTEKGDTAEVHTISECLSLNNLFQVGNKGNLRDFLCGEEPDKKNGEVAFYGVLCGRKPS